MLFKRFLNSRMFSFAVVDGARRAYDVVGEIEVQIAVLDHLAQEGSQVARIQLAGVNRDGGGQVERGHDRHAVHVYGLAGFAQYAIASGRSREVNDDRPALHSGDGLFGDQQRGAAPGHGGGGERQSVCLAWRAINSRLRSITSSVTSRA